MTQEDWRTEVPQVRLRAVQLATACFSLARFYAEPAHVDMLTRFTDPAMAGTWPQRDENSRDALDALANSGETSYEVGDDFKNLFGLRGKVRVTAAARAGGGTREIADDLRARYERVGFVPVKGMGHGPDHVSVELTFLGDLVSKIPNSPEFAHEALAFLEDHLYGLIVPVIEELEASAFTQTYRAIAVLTRSTVQSVEDFATSVVEGGIES